MGRPRDRSGLGGELAVLAVSVVGAGTVVGALAGSAAAGIAAALLVAAAIVVLRRRGPAAAPRRSGRRPAGPAGRRGRQRRGGGTPRPGEIWWGIVPFREGEGSTTRPFLVLDVRGRSLTVFPITKNDYSYRNDYLPFRPDSATSDLAPGAVELRPCTIDLRDVRRRAATTCPPSLWRKVQGRYQPPAPRPAGAASRPGQGGPGRRSA